MYLNLQASRTDPDRLSAAHQPTDAPGSVGGTAQLAGAKQQASPSPAQANDASAPAGLNAPLVLPPEPPRLSDQPEHLSYEELHGGWKLTWEMFDRATKHPNATVVSWSSPRVVLIKDFLAPDEIEHLVHQATGGFERSEVVTDGEKRDTARTSFGSWLSGHKRSEKVRAVQHRIHELVGIPEAFGESLYVLQYAQGQKYDVHNDHCAQGPGDYAGQTSCREFLERAGGPGCGPGHGGVTCGDRLATVILYLRSPVKGGATVFPHARSYRVPKLEPQPGISLQGGAQQAGGQLGTAGSGGAGSGEAAVAQSRRRLAQHGSGVLSDDVEVPWYCAEGASALQVSPPPGTAVLFWDYVPSGPEWQPGDIAQPDPASLHGGCPVVEGTKLIATRWIRAAEFH
ncbi:putative prolyl 4-hydroxylase 10 isoform A [Chlorella sorokiniana]|uniref:Putative prolyl 4-hydroxylase 10 isoform A n=1 Tax=Chlorella sorokiniana TaxID=3076 RepID=A0A2P6TZZ3_CHLSO|nr:putative prolyl 4-hydroxylase 10 isoform B [Chlorella sorokiniana]PRW59636.1 putative prolyl 4-hydroxylase 10 isoform A [Chlorella sorokiniana]|eukprot:PRW59635.1 putative prolyl 4-hydroxylase 10 isoform B [Chlorella sorokiniana]